jgi:hypothetical protein
MLPAGPTSRFSLAGAEKGLRLAVEFLFKAAQTRGKEKTFKIR